MNDDDDYKHPSRKRSPRGESEPTDNNGKGDRDPPTLLTMWRAAVSTVHDAACHQRAVDDVVATSAPHGPLN